MSAEVFRTSSIDTLNMGNTTKTSTALTNVSLTKKPSNGASLDEGSSTGQSQIKLMPILESGENEDKLLEQSASRMNISATTIAWTPLE